MSYPDMKDRQDNAELAAARLQAAASFRLLYIVAFISAVLLSGLATLLPNDITYIFWVVLVAELLVIGFLGWQATQAQSRVRSLEGQISSRANSRDQA